MSTEYILQKDNVFPGTSRFLHTENHLNQSGSISSHGHDFLEFGITLDGYATHIFDDKKQGVSAGSVYMIPVGRSHAISDMDHWRVRNIYLLPTVFSAYLLKFDYPVYLKLQNFLLKYGCNDADIVSFSLTGKTLDTIKAIFCVLDESAFLNSDAYEAFRDHCILNVLLLLSENFYSEYAQGMVPVDPRLSKIVHYIQSHLELPSKQLLQALSQDLALNSQYMNRIVKRNMGITISQYVMQCKIEKSIELLMNGTAPTEAAVSLGYYDYAHFHKYFTKYVGRSPGTYRPMNRQV